MGPDLQSLLIFPLPNDFLKRFLPVCLLFVSAIGARAQGQIVFNNRVTNAVIAAVYDVEPGAATVIKQGNTAAGTPAGTQEYTGAPLSGNSYTAQLFGGPTNSTIDQLVALSPSTTFRSAEGAGFIIAPPHALTVPGVPEGQPAKILMRAWRNVGGITNWQQVLANPETPRGESIPFISPPLGEVLVAPPNPMGLQSFNLALPAVPALPIKIISTSYRSNGTFVAGFTAPTNRTYNVQSSVNLTNWISIQTNLFVPSSPWSFEDADAGSLYSNRFYRLTAE